MPYAQVALPLPLRQPFDYEVPPGMPARVGSRVRVPFGTRSLIGVVTALLEKSEVKGIKPLKALLDEEPLLTPLLLEFTKWISEYYLCGWGEALQMALPPLVKRPRPEAVEPKPRRDSAPKLVPAQEKAADELRQALRGGKAANFLLCGVTGSGKTEVYLAALEEALKLGGTAIVLVPEIALTPQTLARFESRFPGLVAVLHSGLASSQRWRNFEALRSGKARIALGARSALFAPLDKLKLIVVDEESEPSYKQESSPRYHARDAALVRARLEKAVCLLGSATPSFESFHNARTGKYKLLSLPGRVGAAGMPEFEFIDLNTAFPEGKAPDEAVSPRLKEELTRVKARKEQSLLFLNRRGFAPVMACVKCGEAIQCPNCSISLTFHREGEGGLLRCHLCDHAKKPPQECPREKCGSRLLKLLGTGTQRLEDEARRILPGAKVIRVDRDTASGAKAAGFHRELQQKVRLGEVDLLLGTQMIAKGLDFPGVTLVGVVNADASLSFPDFRAEERTYQLLVQVAGRAGRADKPGRVLVQTRQIGHPCLRAAAKQDFGLFFDAKIKERQELGYPPFARLASLLLKSKDKEKALAAATDLGALLGKKAHALGLKEAQILGPAPAALVQVKGWWRYRLLVKTPESKALHALLDPLVFEWKSPGCTLAVDVDPQSFL